MTFVPLGGIVAYSAPFEPGGLAAALPMNRGASVIVVLLLSLGLWAAIWGAVTSSASAVLG